MAEECDRFEFVYHHYHHHDSPHDAAALRRIEEFLITLGARMALDFSKLQKADAGLHDLVVNRVLPTLQKLVDANNSGDQAIIDAETANAQALIDSVTAAEDAADPQAPTPPADPGSPPTT